MNKFIAPQDTAVVGTLCVMTACHSVLQCDLNDSKHQYFGLLYLILNAVYNLSIDFYITPSSAP